MCVDFIQGGDRINDVPTFLEDGYPLPPRTRQGASLSECLVDYVGLCRLGLFFFLVWDLFLVCGRIERFAFWLRSGRAPSSLPDALVNINMHILCTFGQGPKPLHVFYPRFRQYVQYLCLKRGAT